MSKVFIFENWPDRKKDLQIVMSKLVDDGLTYKEAIHAAKRAYLRAILIKMRGKPLKIIARKCNFHRKNLHYLIKKYDLYVR